MAPAQPAAAPDPAAVTRRLRLERVLRFARELGEGVRASHEHALRAIQAQAPDAAPDPAYAMILARCDALLAQVARGEALTAEVRGRPELDAEAVARMLDAFDLEGVTTASRWLEAEARGLRARTDPFLAPPGGAAPSPRVLPGAGGGASARPAAAGPPPARPATGGLPGGRPATGGLPGARPATGGLPGGRPAAIIPPARPAAGAPPAGPGLGALPPTRPAAPETAAAGGATPAPANPAPAPANLAPVPANPAPPPTTPKAAPADPAPGGAAPTPSDPPGSAPPRPGQPSTRVLPGAAAAPPPRPAAPSGRPAVGVRPPADPGPGDHLTLAGGIYQKPKPAEPIEPPGQATAPAATAGLFDRIRGWAEAAAAPIVAAAAPAPPPADAPGHRARLAFDAARRFMAEVLAYVSPRLHLVRTAYDTTGLPAKTLAWAVVARRVPPACERAAIEETDTPWVGHVAKLLLDDARARREVGVALGRWDQARQAEGDAERLAAEADGQPPAIEAAVLARFDAAAFRATAFPLSHLHLPFRGLPHLQTLFPPPDGFAEGARSRMSLQA